MRAELIPICLSIGALTSLVLAGLLVFAAFWEMVLGHRPPGLLGREILSRPGPRRTDAWSAARWRFNGFLLFGFAGCFFTLFFTLALVAIAEAGGNIPR